MVTNESLKLVTKVRLLPPDLLARMAGVFLENPSGTFGDSAVSRSNERGSASSATRGAVTALHRSSMASSGLLDHTKKVRFLPVQPGRAGAIPDVGSSSSSYC